MNLVLLDFFVSAFLGVRYLRLKREAEKLATNEAIRLKIPYAEFKKRVDGEFLSPDYSILSFRVGVYFALTCVFFGFGVIRITALWW